MNKLSILVLILLTSCALTPVTGEGDERTVNQALQDVSRAPFVWVNRVARPFNDREDLKDKNRRVRRIEGNSGDFVEAVILRINAYDPDIPATRKVVSLNVRTFSALANHGALEVYLDGGVMMADHRHPILVPKREFMEGLR